MAKWSRTRPRPPVSPDKKARAILEEHLTPHQSLCLKQHGWYKVRGSRGGVYRIGYRRMEPIISVPEDQKWTARRYSALAYPTSYCIVSQARIPTWDHLLSMTLMIRANETEFRRIAIDRPISSQYVDDWFSPTRRYTNFYDEHRRDLRSTMDVLVGVAIAALLLMTALITVMFVAGW